MQTEVFSRFLNSHWQTVWQGVKRLTYYWKEIRLENVNSEVTGHICHFFETYFPKYIMGRYLFINFVFVIDLLKQQRTIQFICNWVNEIINFDYIWNRLRVKNFCNSYTVEGPQWGS